MKSANRENDTHSPLQRMPEGDTLSKVMSPPPLDFGAPIQATMDEGGAGFEEETEQKSGPGLMQLQKAPGSDDAGDDSGSNNGEVAQLVEEQGVGGQQQQVSGQQQVGDVEQGDMDQEIVDQNITIPGAFDIQNGPSAFHEYLLAPIRSAFTANTFSVKLSFNINLGIKASVLKGLLGVGGGGMFGVEVTLNRQDDRLVRGGWAITYGAQLVSDILWFIHYTREWTAKSSTTAVFRDMFHFSAVCFDVLRTGYNKLAEHTDKLSPIEYNDTPEDGDINWGALSQRPTTKVVGNEKAVNNTLTASVPGINTSVSGSMGSSDSSSRFYKQNGDNTVTKTSTQHAETKSLSAEVSGVGVEVALADTDIANHANSDNDGSYRNVSITFKNFPRMAKLRSGLAGDIQKVKDLVTSTQDPLGALQLALGMIVGLVKAKLDLMTPVERSSWDQFKSGLGSDDTGMYSNTSFTAELNFIRYGDRNDESGSWNLQYFRMSGGANGGFKWDEEAPLATLYGAVDLTGYTNGQIGASANAGIFEVLGENTVSYMITVYNGLVYTQAEVDAGYATDRFSRWSDYRTTHINALKGLVMKLGDPSSVPYLEATGSYGLSPSDALVTEAAACKESGVVSERALQLFENFLYRNYESKMASDGAVAGSTNDLEAQSDTRTPWYQTVGGTSKVYIDMANQANPVLKRSSYKPERQAPMSPKTLLDSLYQEQKVDLELYLNKRETAGIFTDGGGTELETRSFSFSKRMAPEAAIAKLVKNFKSELSGPEHFSVDLLNANFRGTTLAQIWSNYFEVKSRPTRGSGARQKSRQLTSIKASFAAELDGALETFATNLLNNVQIQEAGGDVVQKEGIFFDSEELVVN